MYVGVWTFFDPSLATPLTVVSCCILPCARTHTCHSCLTLFPASTDKDNEIPLHLDSTTFCSLGVSDDETMRGIVLSFVVHRRRLSLQMNMLPDFRKAAVAAAAATAAAATAATAAAATAAVTEYFHITITCIDEGFHVAGVYFNVSKAFDRLRHCLLLTKIVE
ncbi:hypothetical protein J6590_075146 [Homalodisca vitripennis]|nr:hypothetical protein J6590_075146 [Homalodisca vitripennis]